MKDSGNIAPIFEAMHILHTTVVNNTCVPQDIETTAIPYLDNQPVDSQLWNGNFCLISLFGIDIYLEGNTKNITCSLLRIMAFIR